jgi:hypothetical protein
LLPALTKSVQVNTKGFKIEIEEPEIFNLIDQSSKVISEIKIETSPSGLMF